MTADTTTAYAARRSSERNQWDRFEPLAAVDCDETGMRASAVLFIDVVAYSKRSVSEQHAIKRALNADVRLALIGFPLEETVMVDTGDGVAVTFLNDIEQALVVAVKVRQRAAAVSSQRPRFELRIGVNVGPIKLIRDINSRDNVIGVGINTAQRIMNFAEPGQLLVSRTYYEMVSLLSGRYLNAFVPAGRKLDKHMRVHDTYEYCPALPAASSTGEPLAIPRRWLRTWGLLGGAITLLFAIAGSYMWKQHHPAMTESAAPDRSVSASTPSGIIKLAISPWGEIVIDGKPQGASPPLREVRVSPGEHRVEVRNGTSKPHILTVRLAPDEATTLRHRF